MPDEINKPLEDMTRDELFAIAQEKKIPGRYDMKKDELLRAVEEALTAPEGEGGTEEARADLGGEVTGIIARIAEEDRDLLSKLANGGELSDGEPDTLPPSPGSAEANGELERQLMADANAREEVIRQEEEATKRQHEIDAQLVTEKAAADRAAAHAAGQLTEQDRLDILRADDGDLQSILADPDVPEFILTAVRAEVARRLQVAKQAKTKQLMKSPNKQFKIKAGPAGMRYVSPSSYVTTLPVGSIVSPLTHDLLHVEAQGFEWEEMIGVELTTDQLGNQVSTAK